MSTVAASAAVDRVAVHLQLETPENVVLDFQLAGPAARGAAFAIDLLVRFGGLFFILMFLSCTLGQVLQGTNIGASLVLLFLVDWFYFVISEGLFRGKTVGKQALGLRVIQETGRPITMWAAMVRNLLRYADAFPYLIQAIAWLPVHFVGIGTMILTRRFQRVGDILARTVVITERHVVLPRAPVIIERIDPLNRDEISSWRPDPKLLSQIDEFLGRAQFLRKRNQMTIERGHDIAADLAMSLAKRLSYTGDMRQVREFPMAFLARVHVTFIRREDTESDEARQHYDYDDAFVRERPRRPRAGGRR